MTLCRCKGADDIVVGWPCANMSDLSHCQCHKDDLAASKSSSRCSLMPDGCVEVLLPWPSVVETDFWDQALDLASRSELCGEDEYGLLVSSCSHLMYLVCGQPRIDKLRFQRAAPPCAGKQQKNTRQTASKCKRQNLSWRADNIIRTKCATSTHRNACNRHTSCVSCPPKLRSAMRLVAITIKCPLAPRSLGRDSEDPVDGLGLECGFCLPSQLRLTPITPCAAAFSTLEHGVDAEGVEQGIHPLHLLLQAVCLQVRLRRRC